jgi:predicted phage replisome organizer
MANSGDVKWIKLSVSMFDDEKIKLLESMPDYRALQLIWVKLICLAGKGNTHGYIFLTENIPYSPEQLSNLFREPVKTIELALSVFERMNMISVDDNGSIMLINFEKHQDLDKLAALRENTRQRVERHRLKTKTLLLPESCNVTVTECNATEEKRRDKNTLQDNHISSDFSFFKNQLGNGSNKVAVLVSAFKAYHTTAPKEDFDTCGNRIAGMLKQCSNDYGFLLEKIYQAGSKSITGSHLNYINGCLKTKHTTTTPSVKPVNYQELK